MTAKSETVGVVAIRRWECRPLSWEVQYHQRDDGEWVKFTDHESALAELREQVLTHARHAQNAIDGWEREMNLRATLISGLEALAGEWEIRGLELDSVGESEADLINAAALTSAANRLRALIPAAENEE